MESGECSQCAEGCPSIGEDSLDGYLYHKCTACGRRWRESVYKEMEITDLDLACDLIIVELAKIRFAYSVHIIIGKSPIGAMRLDLLVLGVKECLQAVEKLVHEVARKAENSARRSLPIYVKAYGGAPITELFPSYLRSPYWRSYIPWEGMLEEESILEASDEELRQMLQDEGCDIDEEAALAQAVIERAFKQAGVVLQRECSQCAEGIPSIVDDFLDGYIYYECFACGRKWREVNEK